MTRVELLINVDVPELEAAARFYVAAFGFRVGRRLGAGALELLGAGVPLYLLENASGSPATPAPGTLRGYGRHWTPVHLDVVVPDLRAARERALAAGALAEGEISDHAWGSLARLRDPFGHGVCLLQFAPGGYDALVAG